MSPLLPRLGGHRRGSSGCVARSSCSTSPASITSGASWPGGRCLPEARRRWAGGGGERLGRAVFDHRGRRDRGLPRTGAVVGADAPGLVLAGAGRDPPGAGLGGANQEPGEPQVASQLALAPGTRRGSRLRLGRRLREATLEAGSPWGSEHERDQHLRPRPVARAVAQKCLGHDPPLDRRHGTLNSPPGGNRGDERPALQPYAAAAPAPHFRREVKPQTHRRSGSWRP